MKRIGTTVDGVLVEIDTESAKRIHAYCSALYQFLCDARDALQGLNNELAFTPGAGHPAGVHSPGSASGVSLPAAGKKRVAVSPTRAPAKEQPGRVCATRSAGEPRACEDCQKPFTPWRKDQRFCSKCSKHAHPAKHPARVAAMKQARKYAAAMPPVPGKPPASAPEADDAKARRLAAIRAADARLRAKGVYAPMDTDSGIREANVNDIAAVRGKQEDI